jgi:hypothetical protein
MQSRGRTLKFTAVLALVVLALTGFSTGRHGRGHSSSSGGSSGGGGCSSSSQDHDSSSSTSGNSSSGSYGSDDDDYDSSYDDSYGSSGSSTSSSGSSSTRRPNYRSTPTTSSTGSSKPLKDGTAKLISCATKEFPYATIEVSNPNGRKATFSISVTFKDAQDITVVDHYPDVTVPAKDKATVNVTVGGSGLVESVDHCEVDRRATVDD